MDRFRVREAAHAPTNTGVNVPANRFRNGSLARGKIKRDGLTAGTAAAIDVITTNI